jgi:hypothetical protein
MGKKPKLAWEIRHRLTAGALESNEPLAARLTMYAELVAALPLAHQARLMRLLRRGVLIHRSDDDGHSTLYHLYQRLQGRVAPGFNNQALLEDMLSFLEMPYQVSQKPAPVLPSFVQRMQDIEANRSSVFAQRLPTTYVPRRHSEAEMQLQKTFNCPAAAIMFGMADQQPAELVRQLNGLLSPRLAFDKKIDLRDVNPDNPQAALQTFQQLGLRYRPLSATQGVVTVPAPYAVYLRALSDQRNVNRPPGTRDALQTLYQMTLMELPSPLSYDEVNDLMYNPDGTSAGEGLPGEQIDLITSVIEGKGGTQSVTTQVFDAHPNPQTNRQATLPYLFGYRLGFDRTAQALVQSLQMKKLPMLGITYVDSDGAMPGGHYFRVTGARFDNDSQRLMFTVVDSDDDDPRPVEWTAAELVPMINRMHLPTVLARQLNGEITALPPSTLLTPGPEEAVRFKVLPLAAAGATA